MDSSTGTSAVARVFGLGENGLEVRHWLVSAPPSAFADSVHAMTEPVSLSDELSSAMRANGLRLRRLPLRELGSLHQALGADVQERNVWLGQVLDWREIHRRNLGTDQHAIAVDGRVSRYRGGEFTLLVRAWTELTEFGPRLRFQCAPWYAPFDARQRSGGFVVRSSSLSLLAEHGYVYLLIGEAPNVSFESAETSSDELVGPETHGPTTLGEFLLKPEDARGRRVVIVLVPQIPSGLFPEAAESSHTDEPAGRNG